MASLYYYAVLWIKLVCHTTGSDSFPFLVTVTMHAKCLLNSSENNNKEGHPEPLEMVYVTSVWRKLSKVVHQKFRLSQMFVWSSCRTSVSRSKSVGLYPTLCVHFSICKSQFSCMQNILTFHFYLSKVVLSSSCICEWYLSVEYSLVPIFFNATEDLFCWQDQNRITIRVMQNSTICNLTSHFNTYISCDLKFNLNVRHLNLKQT